jgi:outer membrane protein insertion porin family
MKMCPVEPRAGFGWRALAPLVLLVASLAGAFAQSSLKISKIEIRHIGPATVSDELIRSNLRMKEGDAYVRPSVDDDVRNLYATGLFYNIRVGETNAANGMQLTYFVQAKPRLTDIKFTGNDKYDNDKLLAKISSRVGEPLDERKLFTDCQELRKLYEKAGYQGTTVSNAVSIEESTGRGTATFEIAEARKVKIKRVEFVGATAFSQKTLRKQIKTRNRWFFSWLTGSGVYKADQFEEDREKLKEFYRDQGYIDFEIKDVQFERPTPKTMIVKILVSEGIQYKVGNVTFKGARLLPTNAVSPAFTPPPIPKKAGPDRAEVALQRQFNKNFKLKEGDTFTPGGIRRNSEAIEDYYGSKGYIDVNGENLRVAKIPNTEKGTMDLEYTINEGFKSYIEKIEIKGNTKTKDRVIRRELAVAPGEVFDMVRVKVSRNRLEGLQYFDKVDARPEPTDIRDRKNLVIGVEEKNTGNLSLGAGFSSVDAVVGYVEFTQGNFDIANPPLFTGAGQKFRARVQIGTQRKDIQTSFIEPWFLGRKLSLGVDLYHRELSYQSFENLYDEQRTGARLSLTRALGSDFLIGSLSLGVEQVGIVNVETNSPQFILDETGRNLMLKLGASLAYDTRNHPTQPTKGQRTELFGELATLDRQFYKLELKSGWYFKGFMAGDVLEIAGRVGVADSLESADVPFYERYYLGGLTSLRGYRYREIGPRESFTTYSYDSNTNLVTGTAWEPAGGNTYWFLTAEYSTPIIEKLRFAVFYDIGMVYPGTFSFSPEPSRGTGYDTGSYADNWGVGIRLNLPIGPLRLDYGIPITAPPGIGTSGRFQFGAGYTRDF